MRSLVTEGARTIVINFFIVSLLAIWGIYVKRLDMQEMSFFQRFLVEISAPIQKTIASGKKSIDDFVDHYILLVDTSKTNVDLKKSVASLQSKIFSLQEMEKENARLRELLKFGEIIDREQILAQVVGWDSSNEFKVLRINKGKNSGLEVGSAVVTTTGLVGHVYRVSDNFSDILTILDQNSRVDGIVSRTRSHGIVEGMSNFKCSFKYLSRSAPVAKGDVILTAGLGNIYPKGVQVGTISQIQKEENGMTQYIEIVPSVDFHRLEEVLVFTQATETASTAQATTASVIVEKDKEKRTP